MVKRILSLGAAVALAAMMTVSSFAASVSQTYDLSFPFYGRARIRQGGTQLYIDSLSKPISSSESVSLSGAGGTIIFDFYPYTSEYELYDSNVTTFYDHYTIWNITERNEQSVVYDSNGDIDYIKSPFSNFHVESYSSTESTLDLSQYATITATTVKAGSFLLEGFLEFDSDDVRSLDVWNTMVDSVTGSCITSSGSYSIDIPYADFEFHKYNGHDRINYKIALTIPYSGEYTRLFFQLNTSSDTAIPSLTGFSVNTGALEMQAASDTIGFSVLVGGWFSDTISAIKSGFYNLGHLFNANRDDAEDAAANKDQEAVEDAQSKIAEAEEFEASLNSDIETGVSEIETEYMTIPDSFGSAIGFAGWVFTSFYNALGGYQVLVYVPLVLGIVLLLIGRGGRSLKGGDK